MPDFGPRYPIAALCEATGLSAIALSRRLGLSKTWANKTSRRGGLTEYAADRVAVALGLHPANVWDSWLGDTALAEQVGR